MKLMPEFTEVYDKIYGRKTKNARIYRHSGNWAIAPAMFYATSVYDAYKTASNIESDLSVWSPKEECWLPILDMLAVCTIGEEFDEDGNDISICLLDKLLASAGFDLTFDEVWNSRGRKSHVIESAYH